MSDKPNTLKRKEVTIVSPLRYPGAKRRLSRYIEQMICLNNLAGCFFLEPFAGGASVSLQLMQDNCVGGVGLVEKDPLVAAFWELIFTAEEADFQWLLEQVQTHEIDLATWNRLKHSQPDNLREKAWACLFLNRTSFSGILAPSGGPIGGQSQASQYKIDCRFPRETLQQRLQQLKGLRDKVESVHHGDWCEGLAKIPKRYGDKVLLYLDPPFFHKADRLYRHYFNDEEHRMLRDELVNMNTNWILSYDYCEEAKELYEGYKSVQVDLIYSGAQNGGSRKAKEVIITNLPQVPQETRLWRTMAEWKTKY